MFLALSVALASSMLNLAVARPLLPYETAKTPADRRLGFAQTYLGALGTAGRWGVVPSLSLGALHFWGHADLYVHFPLLPFRGRGQDEVGEYRFRYRSGMGETGLHIYPWPLRTHSVRPFAGLSWSPTRYRQERRVAGSVLRGPSLVTHEIPLKAGVAYLSPFGMFELGIAYSPFGIESYPVPDAEQEVQETEPTRPSLTAWIQYKWVLDLSDRRHTRRRLGPVSRSEYRTLSGFFVGLGPSSAFSIQKGHYNAKNTPALRPPAAAFLGELSLGWYSERGRWQVGLSSRPVWMKTSGYGYRQRTRRIGGSLELMRLVGDFHGFAP